MYAVGEILSASTNGVVHAGTRVHDGLEVALKYVHTSRHLDYIHIPGYLEPLPREVALQKLAYDDGDIPVIVQLLDWEEHPDHYILVLDRPSPCEGLSTFIARRGGKLDEKLAKRIIWQASVAANICCELGVFHRNITLENLIIKTDTMDVKLIDFGCGELLKNSTYNTFTGTRAYVCPEFFKTGKYHAKPATVYSLGVLLFAMLCGKFPSSNDQFFINERAWIKDGLTDDTLEVKLIDFGCGDLLKSSTYDNYMGTKKYTCPEYVETGSYHGQPATVYSLGVLLFAIVFGKCPSSLHLKQINEKIWSKDGLTAECCDFIQACLQRNPDECIHLEEILKHAEF